MEEVEAGQATEGPSLRDTIAAQMEVPDTPSDAPETTSAAPAAEPANPSHPAQQEATGAAPAVDKAQTQVPPPPIGFPDLRDWQATPDGTRAWIKQRESQFERGVQKYAEAAKFAHNLMGEIQPYMAGIKARGLHPIQVMAEWAATEHLLTSGDQHTRNQAFLAAAQRYGVNLEELMGQQPERPPQDPRYDALQREFAQVRQLLQQQQEQQAQAEASQIWETVDKFAKDPQREFFSALWPDMADLIEKGVAKDYADAYEKAMWQRPDIRAIVMERDAAKRAQEARAARQASTAGTGTAVSGGATTQPNSVRAAVLQAWDQHAA